MQYIASLELLQIQTLLRLNETMKLNEEIPVSLANFGFLW